MEAQALQSRQAPAQRIFSAGAWVEGHGTAIELVNPATAQPIGTCAAASKADVAEAARAAKASFKTGVWSKKPAAERNAILLKVAEAVEANKERLAMLDTLEMGKPLAEAVMDMDDVVACFKYYTDMAASMKMSKPLALSAEGFTSKEELWPKGVVGAIVPWNYPLLMAAWKFTPALAAGCHVVLKPSEYSPSSALEFAALAEKAGLPAGVLSVLPGYGYETGQALAESEDVDCLSFTGSAATGKRIMRTAAENLVPVTLELGGKSPIVVCEDADIEVAKESVEMGIWFNQGEVCSATSRLIVHKSIEQALLGEICKVAEGLQVGDGFDSATKMGPIVSKVQFDKVKAYIDGAVKQGASIATGGVDDSGRAGFFVKPTVITGVTQDMTIWKEEVFGPVLVVVAYETDEEAIALANDTAYGLAGAVISTDPARLKKFTDGIEAGVMWANCSQPTFVEAPWVPWKRSGFGINLSEHGFLEFCNVKQVTEQIRA